MRYRGLFEYYGKDLIAYKRENPTDQNRNEFLRILSSYMTTHLVDNCPTSWKKCKTSFWEEFIFGYYPHMMLITPEENEVDTFLLELKKFIQWLDKRAGTSFHPLIEKYAAESVTDFQLSILKIKKNNNNKPFNILDISKMLNGFSLYSLTNAPFSLSEILHNLIYNLI